LQGEGKMKEDYWLERWKRDETAFNQDEVNPYLRQYWRELNLAPGTLVFVPLCGKSCDMAWLRDQGHPVLGVELSRLAVEAFFAENSLTPKHISGERFDRYEADRIRILCGNFFNLGKADLADIGAVYDRGGLVALPPETRERYVAHLLDILPMPASRSSVSSVFPVTSASPAIQTLLVTLDYPPGEMEGPPFAVSAEEVEALYQEHGEQAGIRLLMQRDVLEESPPFQERGLSRLVESVFLLQLKAGNTPASRASRA
jgi:thiopurine S-methyltransferase